MNWLKVLRDAFADEWDGIGRITNVITIADVFTLLNALAGLIGVVAAALGQPVIGAAMIAVCVLLDGMDGAAARLWGGGPLGPFLDTLADLLSFGVLPAVLLAATPSGQPIVAFVAGGIWLLAAMLRLARFEALREENTARYHSGMTTTGAAILLAAFLLAGMPSLWVIIWSIILSIWMVSRIRTLKLTFWPLVGGAITLVPTFLSVPLELLGNPLPRIFVLATLLTGMTMYTFVGPFLILGKYGPTPPPQRLPAKGRST